MAAGITTELALDEQVSQRVRRQKLLDLVLLGLAIPGFLFGLAAAVLWAMGKAPSAGALAGFGVQPFYLLAYGLSQRGRVRLATYVPVVILFLVMAGASYQVGVGHAILVGYAIVTLTAALLIGAGAAVFFAFLCVGTHLVIGAVQAAGGLPGAVSPQATVVTDGVAVGLGLVVLVVFLWRSERDLSDTLGRERRMSATLQRQQQELEARVTQLNEAQKALRSSEERLELVFEYAPDAYYLTDSGGVLAGANRAAEELVGHKREEVLGKSLFELGILPADQVPSVAQCLAKSVLRATTEPVEFLVKRQDGSQVPVEVRTYPVQIEGRTLILGIARDVTERKRTEAALQKTHDDLEMRVQERTAELEAANAALQAEIAERMRTEEAFQESEELYRMLVQASPDAVTATDLEGRITFASQRTADLHDYDGPERLLGRSAFELIAPQDHQKALVNLQRTLQEGELRDAVYTMQRWDGSRFIGELNATLVSDADGRPKAFLATTRDITERVRAEQALKRYSERLKTMRKLDRAILAAQSPEKIAQAALHHIRQLVPCQGSAVLLADYETQTVTVFASGSRDEPSTLDGRSLPLEVFRQVAEAFAAIRQGEPYLQDDMREMPQTSPLLRMLVQRGRRSMLIVPFAFEDEPSGVFILVADRPGVFVTEHAEIAQEVASSLSVAIQQARLREELHRHATHLETSLREKEVLLREIHHRVKNNLQVVSSLLSLQSGRVTDERAMEVFQDGQNRIRSMALVHEKLYQSEHFAWVDFAEYIVSLTRYLFRAYRNHAARIRLDIDAEDVLLDVDSAVTCGLIVNELVSNALKHAFPDERAGEIRIELHDDGDRHVVLRVGDNGVGLPQNLNIEQTESLGLRLVNILVEQLDGTITLDANAGTGFEVRFAHPREGS